MDRWTGRRDISEILLKTALNTIQSINESISHVFCPIINYLHLYRSYAFVDFEFGKKYFKNGDRQEGSSDAFIKGLKVLKSKADLINSNKENAIFELRVN